MKVITRYLLGLVERYRNSVFAHNHQGSCRFSPSCSTFALQALEERPLPTAVASIAWRIVRCNPLVRIGTGDPVRRARRLRPRANSVRTAASLLLLGGLMMMFIAGAALGQNLAGGCSATVNGKPITSYSKDNPLQVVKGQRVRAVGTAPGGQKTTGNINVNYEIAIIQGLFGVDASSETHVANGGQWTSTLNVDQYLKRGSGLYQVTGNVQPGSGGWRCSGDFFVNLDGSKTIGIVGGAVAAVGLIGVAGSASAKEPSAADVVSASPSAEDVKKDFGNTVDDILGIKKEPAVNTVATAGAVGCMGLSGEMLDWMMEEAAFFAVLAFPIFGAVPDDSPSRRVWRKGHPALGFFGGLLFGLGAAVALQQFGHWTLNAGTLIAFPILSAIVGAIRGWRGKAFKVTYREGPPPPSAETVANA